MTTTTRQGWARSLDHTTTHTYGDLTAQVRAAADTAARTRHAVSVDTFVTVANGHLVAPVTVTVSPRGDYDITAVTG